jgi:hypothetical protein
MQVTVLVLCCLTLTPDQFPGPEYDGPAYACRTGQTRSMLLRLSGEALVRCVQMGMKPEQIQQVFGPPLLQSYFRCSPVEWWYPDLGVTVHFPPRLLAPAFPGERVRGGIE